MYIVSIVIPAYNAGAYIGDLIDSLYNQKISKSLYQLVIVNDGSTDNTALVISDCRKKYPDLRILYLEQSNQGVSMARNNGLSLAEGEFVWFVDADDWIAPHALEEISTVILNNPDIDGIKTGDCIDGILNEDGSFNEHSFLHYDVNAHHILPAYMLLDSQYSFGHTTYIWKRSFLQKNHLHYPENINNNEDFFFLLRSLLIADTVYVNLSMLFYYYRELHESLSRGVNTFEKVDTKLKGSIFVLERMYEIKESASNNSLPLVPFLEKRIFIQKKIISSILLQSKQPLCFFLYYKRFLKKLGCIPFDKDNNQYKGKIKMLNNPIIYLFLSQIFRIDLFQKFLLKCYNRSL